MSNTPSDAEIEKLAAEHLKAFAQFSGAGDVWVEGEVAFARAVLAKWGTQPQAGAVPQRWKAVPVNPTPEMWKAAKSVPDPNPPYPPPLRLRPGLTHGVPAAHHRSRGRSANSSMGSLAGSLANDHRNHA